MGRPRSFDRDVVVDAAAALFVRQGYDGSSVDDLVGATGLHRGSLYQAFGSKRGIFLAALRQLVTGHLSSAVDGAGADDLVAGTTLDLLLVAALELAPHDVDVRELVTAGCARLDAAGEGTDSTPALLGRRLLRRAGVGPANAPAGGSPTESWPGSTTASAHSSWKA